MEQLAAAPRGRLSLDLLSELMAWLQERLEPVERSLLCAPFDDQPTSPEEGVAVTEARQKIVGDKRRDLAAVRADLAHAVAEQARSDAPRYKLPPPPASWSARTSLILCRAMATMTGLVSR